MKISKERKRTTIVIFAATAIVVSLLLPARAIFFTQFSKGQTWKQQTLTAPFNFPIYKENSEVLSEQRHYMESFVPVYKYDTLAVYSARQKILADFPVTDTVASGAPDSTASFNRAMRSGLLRITGRLNTRGVIDKVEKTAQDRRNDLTLIRVYDYNKMLSTLSLDEALTLPAAIAQAQDSVDRLLKTLGRSGVNAAPYVSPNIYFDEALNSRLRDSELSQISATKGMVREGEVVIAQGQVIDDEALAKLESLSKEYSKRIGTSGDRWQIILGHFLLVGLIFLLNYIYLLHYRTEILSSYRKVLFLMLMYAGMTGLYLVVSRIPWLNIYVVPFAVVPIFILTFFGTRMAIYHQMSILVICSLLVPVPFEFLVVNLLAGISATLVLGDSYVRKRIFVTAGVLFLAYTVSYLAMVFIRQGDIEPGNLGTLIWFLLNILLLLGFYQLVFLFEKAFGFVSSITLLELCDTNHKLLLELSQKAPGTFQHSLQVAALAEAAAKEIGANGLLARTGALYHDIGKINNPGYFIENVSDRFNPHTGMLPLESAGIIRSHVPDGVALARSNGLPEVVVNFIASHHGDSLMYFFYSLEKEQHPDAEPDQAAFRYSGPRPRSKEASICMMADAIEAASRTLTSYGAEDIDNLIENIVAIQIREGQFKYSRLSFDEVEKAKEVFKNKLANIYHTRIVYPDRT